MKLFSSFILIGLLLPPLTPLNAADAPPTAKKIRIACIGDSITEGARLADPAHDSYPARLQVLLGAGYDEIRQIDSRYEFGPGMGEHLLKLTNFVLNAEVGFNYQVQNFTRTTNQMQKLRDDQFHYRFGQDLKWLIGSQFTFDEKAEYLPVWNHLAEYRMRVEANLRYWLKANLSLNLTVINVFDTVTAKGVEQNDLQVRSSIGVKF